MFPKSKQAVSGFVKKNVVRLCWKHFQIKNCSRKNKSFHKIIFFQQSSKLLQRMSATILLINLLKVPKCAILISWILIIFFSWSLYRYFRDEIKILHILQIGEIRAIMFLLPHAPSTLQIATACAAYASKGLPHAQHTLAIGYRTRRVR